MSVDGGPAVSFRQPVHQMARSSQGLERLDQVEYAVLERDGRISIIPGGARELLRRQAAVAA